MIVIDNRDKRAIYEQVVERLSNLMLIGALQSGEKLPSVRNLAVDLSINPNTIQKAYLELERQGYVYSVKGVGSFVADIDVIKNNKKKMIFEELGELIRRAKTFISKAEFTEKVDELYKETGKESEK